MTADDAGEDIVLVLAPDVLIVRVTDLSAEVRARLDVGLDEFAISRPRARTTTHLVDADAAALLEEFRAPTAIGRAVAAYCTQRQLDLREVSGEALPFIQHFQASGMLVRADLTETHQTMDPSLAAGERVENYTVVRMVHLFEDVEIYQVRGPDGKLYALKIARHAQHRQIEETLQREVAILGHLQGCCAPALWANGTYCGRRWLIMEWCEGSSAWLAAETCREDYRHDGHGQHEGLEPDTYAVWPPKLLLLCGDILHAYASLHARGVVHGDVHPRNVVVDARGAVRLLDFGLGRLEDAGGHALKPTGRGGIGFYFEPEWARARLLNEVPPLANQRGEQYAVAALVYLLLTGKPYLNFGLERTRVLKQIVVEEPLPFARHQLPAWPDLERVLHMALSKDPLRRFLSMEEFERQFRSAASAATQLARTENAIWVASRASDSGAGRGKAYLDTVLERLGHLGDPEGEPSSLAVLPATVGVGMAGIAYFCYRTACLRDEPRLLARAEWWAYLATRRLNQPSTLAGLGAGGDATPPEADTYAASPAMSLYYGASGVHSVRILVSQALGDFYQVEQGMRDLVALAGGGAGGEDIAYLDLTRGSAGSLLGCALVVEALEGAPISDVSDVMQRGSAAQHVLLALLDRCGPIRSAHQVPFLGIAHGWAGILYALLRWAAVTRTAPCPQVEERLEQLAECGISSTKGICWPRSAVRDLPPWVGWCHGSAGFVHLWKQAYQLSRDTAFLDLARGAAEHTWQNPHPRVTHLCCGLAGQAEALLTLYQLTGEGEWLARAQELGNMAFVRATSPAASPVGMHVALYKGDVGLALLALDLAHPTAACMPLFEAERWL